MISLAVTHSSDPVGIVSSLKSVCSDVERQLTPIQLIRLVEACY